MKKTIRAGWAYFVDMNSEKGGGVSIKRNVTWGIATLLVFVQVFTLCAVFNLILRQPGRESLVDVFKFCAWFFATVDATIILLALRITSVEKLSTLVGTIRGGVQNPTPAPEKQGGTAIDTTTETRQGYTGQ